MSDDVSLVASCLRGDTRAIQDLIERFQSIVFGVCIRILGHRQDAEDVAQEVFLRVFRSLRRWDSSRPLKPWIMGITVNRCRTWLSRRVREPQLREYLEDTAAERPADDVAELAREIDSAVRELRWEYRSVFVMYHMQGQPYQDIAQAIRKPVGTVKTWLHRARMEVLERLRRRGMIAEVDDGLP